MKVIFLDHDGVICLSPQWGSRYKKQRKFYQREKIRPYKIEEIPIELRFDNFDKKAVKILNKIIEETDSEIVISSDWRFHATLEEMQEMYRLYGVIKAPIGMTKSLSEFDSEANALFSYKNWLERIRCLEIQRWISENSIDSWVAIDDLNMSNEFLKPGLDNFVLTSKENEGIKQSGISNKIISILQNETVFQ